MHCAGVGARPMSVFCRWHAVTVCVRQGPDAHRACRQGVVAGSPRIVPLSLPCSDDVDDQYTEKGRQLIRKEGEALAAGMRIGEVLAAGDLELPGVVPRKKQGAQELVRSCLNADGFESVREFTGAITVTGVGQAQAWHMPCLHTQCLTQGNCYLSDGITRAYKLCWVTCLLPLTTVQQQTDVHVMPVIDLTHVCCTCCCMQFCAQACERRAHGSGCWDGSRTPAAAATAQRRASPAAARRQQQELGVRAAAGASSAPACCSC